jgi:dienelactone hydrolase
MGQMNDIILRLSTVLFFFIFKSEIITAQKQLIDTNAINNWSYLGNYNINADGQYVYYNVNNNNEKDSYLMLQSVKGDRKFMFKNIIDPSFSINGKYFIYKNSNDSLIKFSLSSFQYLYIGLCKSYELSKWMGRELIVYYSKSDAGRLLMKDLISEREFKYDSVESFLYKDNSSHIVIVKKKDHDGYTRIGLLNRSTMLLRNIWVGKDFSTITANRNLSKLAVLLSNNDLNTVFIIEGSGYKQRHLIGDSSKALDGMHIKAISNFSDDDKRLRFILENKKLSLTSPTNKLLDIYSYKSRRMGLHADAPINRNLHAVINLTGRDLFFGDKYETDLLRFEAGEHVLITKIDSISGDQYTLNSFVYSEKTGLRVKLHNEQAPCYISPYGGHIVFFDFNVQSYASYDIAKDKYVLITERDSLRWLDNTDDHPKSDRSVLKPIAWLSDKKSFLLSDNFDIWRIDLYGKTKPVCLTKGIGRKNNISFSLTALNNPIIPFQDSILLSAFNNHNKMSGFYRVYPDNKNSPRLLSLLQAVFKNIKASPDQSSFLVTMESDTLSPNIFYTKDFNSYQQLSAIAPEKKYNWIKTELVEYNIQDKQNIQGILYKPENFDSTKKYPVIVNYYERVSNRLYAFSEPDLSYAEINIPYFVSNGYLVFTPDIHYKTGFPGKSAFNCVMSGVDQLKHLTYVDSNFIGIQGHSFGGFETNYIVTHTNKFAAAMSASGPSNFISDYGSVFGSGDNRHGIYQVGQCRIGASIFKNLESYIENSPVLYADNVTTPILLMMNKPDGAVPFSQGVEFFTALQGLGKKVWMLNYFEENHFLTTKEAGIDYTTRLFQFFDHYLKGKPIPDWMK